MSVISLSDIQAEDRERVGAKAATLAELMREGFPVPPGFVVTSDAFDAEGAPTDSARAAILAVARRLAARSLAVRSSALAEDLADASYAGQYTTLLNVPNDDGLIEAVRRVRVSGRGSAQGYRARSTEVAVLVQPMLDATAAGVAFTADPIGGARDTTLIQAVRGLGEPLVAGTADAEEWRVRDGSVARRGSGDRALDSQQVLAIAGTARRIAERYGTPQDVEWAFSRGELHILQSRPITALPDAVSWNAPPGAWARNFRLGEWIGEPVTPLFESWLLTTMEETMHQEYSRLVGQHAPRPLHIVVNGWYYYSLKFLPASFGAIARMLPGLLLRLARDPRRIAPVIPPLARFGIELYVREWREVLLPRYRESVGRAADEMASATPRRVVTIIDELAVLAGLYFTSVTFVAGYGWKTEIPLARFYRRHLQAIIGGHHQLLLRGLLRPRAAAHAVQSLDWWYPTQGEADLSEDASATDARLARLKDERETLEVKAREALGRELARQFDRLLSEAQRASQWREEQVADLTLAWPVFRHALRRVGDALVMSGTISEPDDVYFLDRGELDAALRQGPGDVRAIVDSRRRLRARQRRLVAPLVIGRMPPMLGALLGAAERALRDEVGVPADAVRGTPASPGRATGRARVIRSSDEFGRVAPGDVLVCPVTTPSWTPLFARVAAVVTDVGSPAAHASIIAREYGIPAVVGTGDGTARISDGDAVTVDGGAGFVSRAGS